MAIDDSQGYDRLDRLAEEFADRFRRGERPSLKEYADRYPELADEIRELFPAMAQVEQAKEICHGWDEAERADGPPSCRRTAIPEPACWFPSPPALPSQTSPATPDCGLAISRNSSSADNQRGEEAR